MSFDFTDGKGFERAANLADFVVLAISRDEVESGNVSSVLDRLLELSDSRAHVIKFRDALAFAFNGYDEDPRELHQIPEVVAYFRQISKHWNYWAHFVDKVASDSFGLVFWLQCDLEVIVAGAGVVGYAFKDAKQVGATLQALFDAMNSLYEAYGIDEDQNVIMSQKVLDAFTKLSEPS